MNLTTKQKAFLKKKSNNLKTIVQIGGKGISENIIQSIEEALQARELIKIMLNLPISEERKKNAESIAERTNSHLIQVLGKTILLYRKNPDNPKISIDVEIV